MPKIKSYQCKFCKKYGSRKSVRACIMTHIKTNKSHGGSGERIKSNITEAMIIKELD